MYKPGLPLWFRVFGFITLGVILCVAWFVAGPTTNVWLALTCLALVFALGFATDWFLARDRKRLREEGLDVIYDETDLEIEPPSRQRRQEPPE